MMRKLGASFMIVLAAAIAHAATWQVNPDGSGDFPTLQAAIDAASAYDTILLGSGVFRGPGNRDLLIAFNHLRIASLADDPSACIIDLQDHAIVESELGWMNTFRAIRFLNGRTVMIHRSSMEFEYCEFIECEDVIRIDEGDAVFNDCLLLRCIELFDGVYAGGADFDRCLFEENQGGLSMGSCSFIACSFIRNQNEGGMLLGGGTGDTEVFPLQIEDCLFIGNASGQLITVWYGGIDYEQSILGSVFIDNRGTLITTVEAPEDSGLVVRSCTFAGNRGEQDADIRVEEPSGPGAIRIERSIFAFRHEGSVFALSPDEENILLVDCDLFGNAGGDWVGPIADQLGVGCNMAEHPQFCNWAGGAATLFSSSSCLPENNACGALIGAAGVGCDDPTAVPGSPACPPRLAARPNPFNPATRLNFTLPRPARVDLEVHDPSGRRVAILLDGVWLPAGYHGIDWDASPLPSGIYLARLAAGDLRSEAKLTLLR